MRSPLLVLVAACGGDSQIIQHAHIIVDGYNATSDDCRAEICDHNELKYTGARPVVSATTAALAPWSV